MAAWTLSLLRKVERVALPAAQAGVRLGLTASEALRQFRAAGGAIRSQVWYDLYRATGDLYRESTAAVAPPRPRLPAYSRLPKATTKLWRRYSFQVELRGVRSREEGDEGYFVTVSTSRQMTYEEIAATALAYAGYISEDEIEGDIVPIVHSGMQAGPMGTRL